MNTIDETNQPNLEYRDSWGRLTRVFIHMMTAFLWAERSLDPRLKVGAVITTFDLRRVLSVGYNGPARGVDHSIISAVPGQSNCLHAEDNAIAFVNSTIPDKVMFVTDQPCHTCSQRIINADIQTVYYARKYRDESGVELLRKQKVNVIHLHMPYLAEMAANIGTMPKM